MSNAAAFAEVSLEDKYANESGKALMSGIQALVRMILVQRRLDLARGLNTGVFVSGYQGSPLGGFDRELQRAGKFLDELGVVFQPGLNEELAATAVAGTQLLGELTERNNDGVVGFWFGKNPGLDRAADAIRHGTVSGTAPLGGAVALIGDDPGCKSSTIPSSCEPMCRSLLMPVMAPGNVAELIELGLHAVALSRDSGLWTAVKIVADIADASATVPLADPLDFVPAPLDRDHRPPILLPPTSVAAEASMLGPRLDRAVRYGSANRLNRISFEPGRPRFAVVAAGMAYQALLRALSDLGVGESDLNEIGIRLVKLSMPWPMDPAFILEFADGVEQVLVVEDKVPFIEGQIKEALYGRADVPSVIGHTLPDGSRILPAEGTIQADDVASALLEWLPEDCLPADAGKRLNDAGSLSTGPTNDLPKRTPYFCSGCPHNRSTKAEDDSLVGVGIGCHIMVALDEGGRGKLLGMPQMGGEGAQWLGLAPFCDDVNFTQNIGDGTFQHSGSLAIRAAVAAGSRITYKLLYNDAVAMTGGQHPEGQKSIRGLTRLLASEGVRSIVVVTPEPEAYRRQKLDPIASVRHRDELAEAEAELGQLEGVKVVIYDDRCAAQERSLRKRGKLPSPTQRVWINERVCEGCGDCGDKSTCLSVQPVETEFGRKTRIHQASCNQDFSCLDGDCPSFLVVEAGESEARQTPKAPIDLPDPGRVEDEVLLRMPGIGGTGVVTVSQILQMAAHLEGLDAAGLEQTGLAQKGGPVISDIRMSPRKIEGSLRANRGTVDVLIGFDLLGTAAPVNLQVAEPERTVAVVSTSHVPTARMVTDTEAPVASDSFLRRRVDRATRSDDNIYIDAQELSLRLFGDHLPANLLLIGATCQAGLLPVGADSIERAIELNGASVSKNIEAFRWGRTAVASPEVLDTIGRRQEEPPAIHKEVAKHLADAELEGGLRELIAVRASDLVEYQNLSYAREYVVNLLDATARIEASQVGKRNEIAIAYARGLYKLMAYKDEYEVARLHLDSLEKARLNEEFGKSARVKVLLHPPLLRALGMKRKLRVGSLATPLFGLLRKGKFLRGRRLDPFGWAKVRRVERALIGEYKEAVASSLDHLDTTTEGLVLELTQLTDQVRGYEEIKLANIEAFRRSLGQSMEQITRRQKVELPVEYIRRVAGE